MTCVWYCKTDFPELDTYANETMIANLLTENSNITVLTILRTKTLSHEALIQTSMYILAKLHDEISGNGFECSISSEKILLTETFFGQKYPAIHTSEIQRVDKDNCWSIINSKTCENFHFLDEVITRFNYEPEIYRVIKNVITNYEWDWPDVRIKFVKPNFN